MKQKPKGSIWNTVSPSAASAGMRYSGRELGEAWSDLPPSRRSPNRTIVGVGLFLVLAQLTLQPGSGGW